MNSKFLLLRLYIKIFPVANKKLDSRTHDHDHYLRDQEKRKRARQGLNPRPFGSKPNALPTALLAPDTTLTPFPSWLFENALFQGKFIKQFKKTPRKIRRLRTWYLTSSSVPHILWGSSSHPTIHAQFLLLVNQAHISHIISLQLLQSGHLFFIISKIYYYYFFPKQQKKKKIFPTFCYLFHRQ